MRFVSAHFGAETGRYRASCQLKTSLQAIKLPAIYEWRQFAVDGGLMSYGTILTDAYSQAGNYAARIRNGVNPGYLPVVLPIKFQFVINLKTAKTLGLEISPTLSARADEVIE